MIFLKLKLFKKSVLWLSLKLEINRITPRNINKYLLNNLLVNNPLKKELVRDIRKYFY